MNYIVAVLIVLLALKIVELHKRLCHLEDQNPSNSHKSVLVERPKITGADSNRVYVIPNMFRKKAS